MPNTSLHVRLSTLALVLLAGCANAPDVPVTERALANEREAFRVELIEERIEANLARALSDSTEAGYLEAFWAAGLAQHRSEAVEAGIRRALADTARSRWFTRTALEAAYGLYPAGFEEITRAIADTTSAPRLFAMAGAYLHRAGTPADSLRGLLRTRFPGSAHPILTALDSTLTLAPQERIARRPPLADLVRHRYGVPVVLSVQRLDRRYPGLALVMDADGTFISNNGIQLAIPQLALSASGLPGTITNGNTPQGLLSIQDIGASDNVFIGPSPTLVSVLPHETDRFVHGSTEPVTQEAYAELLPETWQSYYPIFEAYLAGEAGRTEVIAHGTTIDSTFYAGQPYFPNSPSLGCLTAYESWSPTTGRRVASAQQALVDAYLQAGGGPGYLIVVELDDERRPVTLADIEREIQGTAGG
ncbi:MAG: hypothetical protein AAF752_05310 [Bacteroidota bacterium]